MDTCTHRAESVPARRTKSWKREHQQTCTRRFQSTNSRADRQSTSDTPTNVVVWELPHPGVGTPTRNYNYNYRRKPVFKDASKRNSTNGNFATSRQYFRSSANYSSSNGVKNEVNDSCSLENNINNNNVSSIDCLNEKKSIASSSDSGGSLDALNRDCQDKILLSPFHSASSQFLTNSNVLGSEVDQEVNVSDPVTIDSVSKCLVMRGQCIRIKTCEEIESNIQNLQLCADSSVPQVENQDHISTDEELSVGVDLEISKGVQSQDNINVDMSNQSKSDNAFGRHGSENHVRGDDIFPTNSGLSPRYIVSLENNLTQIKLLDLEQQKKLHTSCSLMDVESRSRDCTECTCSQSLLSNGLIGYIMGVDHHIEIVTVSCKEINIPEVLKDTVESSEQDKQEIIDFVAEAEQRISIKTKLRSINRTAASQRPEEEYFTKLDPSVKKNTAFVRRLKTFTTSQLNGLLKDMQSLNLTKYISEVAAALVESKLKMTDVWPAVQICNIFHQTYSEFSTYLLCNWQKVLSMKKDEPISNQAKLRVDLRFYAELISAGVFTSKEGLPLLGNVLTMLIHMDKDDHYNIKIILSFCRHCGDDYAGVVPRKIRMLSEKYNVAIPHYKLLSEEKQRNVRILLNDYYDSLCKHLLKEHLALQELTRQNRRILQTRGELGSERKERLEVVQVSYNRIMSATQQLAEVLDKNFPRLPEDESLKIVNVESDEGMLAVDLWDDEEMRCFYECFPDLKEFVPNIQVKLPDLEPIVSEEMLDIEFEGDLFNETTTDEDMAPVEEEVEELEPTGCKSNKMLLETLISSLPHCINQEMIDTAAVEFLTTLNTKHNRKKLVRALFNVSRVRLDLLPFYARFVATIHPIIPEVASDLAQMLKQDFKYHVRKKDQLNIESKIKVVRFIGEMVKFHMYPKFEGLYCLKVLVRDFSHHHIEMCCNFLETCGRFFFRQPDCYQIMKTYLDQIMRKKSVMALDSRYVTLIENAYYCVNPPEGIQCFRKERPDDNEFIRKILYQDLSKSNVDEILCLMLKLEWDNCDAASYAIKCLTYAFKVKYLNICSLASLLAGLVVEYEFVGTQVIDGVLEDIQLGMEVNLLKYNQRRVAMIKYLGELYNYRMVENSNIFQVLYSLITFGVSWDHMFHSPLDPPENVFRIRLICILLDTCGEYFVSGSSKTKLDVYLIFFQYYYWIKFSHPCWCTENPFPIRITYMFQDTVTKLRPKIHMFTSLVEAKKTVDKFCSGQDFGTTESEPSESDNWTENENVDEELDNLKDEKEIDERIEPLGEEQLTPNISDESLNPVTTSVSKDSCLNEDIEELEVCEEEDELIDSLCEFEDPNVKWNDDSKIKYCNSEIGSQNEKDVCNSDKSGPQHKPTLVDCPEDEEFLNAFDRMVSDNIQNRMQETVNSCRRDITVPLHIRGCRKKSYDMLATEETTDSIVNFVLIVRKGHKQQYKNLVVPVNSEMALNLRNHEEAERMEKEQVKRLTLNISERLEEEDYQETLSQTQRPITMNLNRERRPKYQHLKGVPDSDLIFCSKKVR